MAARLLSSNSVLGVTALLTFAVWSCGLLIEPYRVVDTLAFTDGFPGDISNWQISANKNILIFGSSVSLSGVTQKTSLLKYQVDLEDKNLQSATHLRSWVKIQPVDLRKAHKGNSGVSTWISSVNEKRISYRNLIFLPATKPVSQSQHVMKWPEQAKSLTFRIFKHADGPSLTVLNAQLESVERNPVYRAALILILLIAILWILSVAVLILSRSTWIASTTLVLILAAVVTIFTIPANSLMRYTHRILSENRLNMDLGNLIRFDTLSELSHFIVFAAVTVLACTFHRILRLRLIESFYFIVIFALLTEGLQLLVIDRGTDITDILFNLIGVATGSVIYYCSCRLLGR